MTGLRFVLNTDNSIVDMRGHLRHIYAGKKGGWGEREGKGKESDGGSTDSRMFETSSQSFTSLFLLPILKRHLGRARGQEPAIQDRRSEGGKQGWRRREQPATTGLCAKAGGVRDGPPGIQVRGRREGRTGMYIEQE